MIKTTEQIMKKVCDIYYHNASYCNEMKDYEDRVWVDKEKLLFDLLELQGVIKEFRKTHTGLQPISVKIDVLIKKVKGVYE